MNTAEKTFHSFATHNGRLTVRSCATGEHRTFQVRSAWFKGDDKEGPPRRLVELLTGPDNESDYQAFGQLEVYRSDDPHPHEAFRIKIWRRFQEDSQFARLARMLERIEEHEEAGRVELFFEGRCRRCNRALTVPESIESGIGPTCAGRE